MRAREAFGAKSYGKFSGIVMNAGDEMLFVTPSGGGYGDPLERDPALVLEDRQLELITAEVARDVYGVVIDPEVGVVDLDATEALRAGKRGLRCRSTAKSTRCRSALLRQAPPGRRDPGGTAGAAGSVLL